jgi:DNA repair protein NreA
MKDFKFEVIDKTSQLKMKALNLGKLSKFEGASPPTIFIGSKLKYPQVNVGILSPIEKVRDAQIFDDPGTWAQKNFSIQDVISLRENLLNSRFQSNVTDVRISKKFLDIAKNIAISSKPVDVEIELKNEINFGKKVDRVLTPHGMSAGLKKARVTSNLKIDQKVDRVMNDEIKSVEGLNYLYQSGINEYSLSKILSVGVLGLKKDKKMVPTRWSITATDDTLTKELLKNVRDYKWVEDYQFFFGEFMGNQFLIFLFPNVWSFELFELYYPGSSWNSSLEMKASTDSEGFRGRTNYAQNCGGGYYACRLPIVEYLNKIKRQAGVLVVRLETPSYWAALGVWVVRESVRKALEIFPMKFDSKETFLSGAKKISKIKYDFDLELIYDKSILLKTYGVQKNLRDWF